jgi:hypothetical protein
MVTGAETAQLFISSFSAIAPSASAQASTRQVPGATTDGILIVRTALDEPSDASAGTDRYADNGTSSALHVSSVER